VAGWRWPTEAPNGTWCAAPSLRPTGLLHPRPDGGADSAAGPIRGGRGDGIGSQSQRIALQRLFKFLTLPYEHLVVGPISVLALQSPQCRIRRVEIPRV